MSLAKVLEEDYRLLHHMCHISNDFVEGIRAKLIEKDNNARWKPATVDEVLSSSSSVLYVQNMQCTVVTHVLALVRPVECCELRFLQEP